MSKIKFTPATILTDIVLTGIVWFLFMLWFRPHVQSYEPMTVFLIASYTAIPAAGTFWFCAQMFRVTLAHQRMLKKEREEKNK